MKLMNEPWRVVDESQFTKVISLVQRADDALQQQHDNTMTISTH